jgi:serine protease SohB
VVKLDSPGGTVTGYGLAASQLQRIKDRGVKLTVLIDQVAASGGYMMAVVAHNIYAAPFAYIGSVGVVSEFPNFNKLLEKFGVEWKTYTAGESKRDVGQYGKITPEAEKRLNKKLADIHTLFKNHVKSNRPQVDVSKIATGEVWTAAEAVKLKMVDGIRVSDEYILEQIQVANVYNVYTPETRSKIDKILESVFNIAIKKAKAFWVETQGEKFL